MALKLPLYLIVGEQPVSLVETPDGGGRLLGWDFEKKEMTRDAASWDDVVDTQPGVPVQGNTDFSEGETRTVTLAQFNRQIRKLRKIPVKIS